MPPLSALLQWLLNNKVFSGAQLVAVAQYMQSNPVRDDRALVNLRLAQRDQLGDWLAACYGCKYINVAQNVPDEDTLAALPHEFIHDKQVAPLDNKSGRLVVAMVNPTDRSALDEMVFITGQRPQVWVTSSLDFADFESQLTLEGGNASSQLYDQLATTHQHVEQQLGQGGNTAANLRQQQEAEINDVTSPLVQLVNSVLHQGILQGASDIHIEPRGQGAVVRLRTDGILAKVIDVPMALEAAFVSRIKVMASMDISDHRRPQDGRITLRHKETDYNLRVNSLPIAGGREKVVIRILRPSKQIADFTELGFNKDEIVKLQHLYQAPYGIVLVCGPTGSGKTTTLYTVLHKINDEERNISTIEDPVELRIEGLNQSQVNAKADFTFASSLRALLRQDPDVIMVGEIRDFETLESAIHAALTGHLVFSTIHANTSAATLTRMLEMGASPSLISSAINGVIAQRLVRKLCDKCKEPYDISHEECNVLFNKPTAPQSVRLMKAKGCRYCKNTGYTGRVGIYEIMTMDRELRQLIVEGKSDMAIEDAAIKGGMRTLGMSTRMAVLKGQTSFEEAVRVMGPNLSGN
jgi:type IV pilus assembly protein PilB